MTCSFGDNDGAYVLGALSPAERLAYEQHLDTCADCTRAVRQLAGLPGLLARVDPAVLEEPADAEPVPEAVLTNLVWEVRRARRRRRLATAGLAAAAILAVAALAFSTLRGPDEAQPPAASAPGLAMTPVGDAPVHARLALESVAWGTRLQLACTYAPDASWTTRPHAPTYTLFVRTRDGQHPGGRHLALRGGQDHAALGGDGGPAPGHRLGGGAHRRRSPDPPLERVSDLDDEVAVAYTTHGETPALLSAIDRIVERSDVSEARRAFERAGARDFLGLESDAIPLYREALDRGLGEVGGCNAWFSWARRCATSATRRPLCRSFTRHEEASADRRDWVDAFLALALHSEGSNRRRWPWR